MTPRRRLIRTLLASTVLAAALALGGCETENPNYASRAMKPIPEPLLAEIQKKNMAKDSPILIRLFKESAELEVWKEDRTGRFALLKTYPICRWSGELGPKFKEGDRQAPEGFYSITRGQMNPNSEFYLSFNLGYPNAYDQAWGRTGKHLMVHGDCSSRGCYAMTDEQITEIYALGRESFFGGQRSFQVQAYPFRMTASNLAKHRNSPHFAFWKMLKVGNDHFEVTRREPKVDVCEKRYVFDAAAPADSSTPLRFNNKGKCPAYEIPSEIASAVNEKQRRDDIQLAELTARNIPTLPTRTGQDGGMHPLFAAALGGQEVRDSTGNIRALAALPGTTPTIRLPRDTSVAANQSAPAIRIPISGSDSTPASQPKPETAVAFLTADVPVPRAAPEPKEGIARTAIAAVSRPAAPAPAIQTARERAAEQIPSPAPRPLSQPSTVQIASVEPVATTASTRPAAKPSLFSNLFGTKTAAEPKTQVQAAAQPEPQVIRPSAYSRPASNSQTQAVAPPPAQAKATAVARAQPAIGLRASEKPTEMTSTSTPAATRKMIDPAPVHSPAPVKSAAAHGAIRVAKAAPAPIVEHKEPKRQAPPPVRTASREPTVSTFSNGNLLSGAQATVPVGSFR